MASAEISSKLASANSKETNTRWAWLLVGTGFIIWFVVDGIVVSYAVLLNHFLKNNDDMPLLSWIGSIARGHVMVIGIVGGPLTKRYGCPLITMIGCFVCFLALLASSFVERPIHLLFSFSIFGGWGYSLALMPSVFQATLYFKEHKALALGIITSGSGAGPMVFAPLSQYIIYISSWREVFIVNSIICLILCLFIANHTRPESPLQTCNENYQYWKRKCRRSTAIKSPCRSGKTHSPINWRMEAKSFRTLLAIPRLMVMCSAGFATHLGQFTVPLFLPAYASASGFDDFSSALLLSYYGIANTLGRICIGWLMDKNWLPVIIIYLSVLLMGSVVTFCIPFLVEYYMLAMAAVLYGVSIGTNLGARSVVVFEYMGDELFHESFGLYLLATGFGSALGPPMSGYIYEATSQNYVGIFGVGAAFLMAGFLVWSLLPFVKHKKKETVEEVPQPLQDVDILCGYD